MACYIVIPTTVNGRIDEAKLKEVEYTPDWRRFMSDAANCIGAALDCLRVSMWTDIKWLAVQESGSHEWNFLEVVREQRGICTVTDFNLTTVCRWAGFIHAIDYDKDCFDRLAKINQHVAGSNFNTKELIGLVMEGNQFAEKKIKEGTALFSYRKAHETEWTTKLIVGKTTYELLDLPVAKQDDPPSPLAQQFQNLSRADLKLIATALQKAGV